MLADDLDAFASEAFEMVGGGVVGEMYILVGSGEVFKIFKISR